MSASVRRRASERAKGLRAGRGREKRGEEEENLKREREAAGFFPLKREEKTLCRSPVSLARLLLRHRNHHHHHHHHRQQHLHRLRPLSQRASLFRLRFDVFYSLDSKCVLERTLTKTLPTTRVSVSCFSFFLSLFSLVPSLSLSLLSPPPLSLPPPAPSSSYFDVTWPHTNHTASSASTASAPLTRG